MAIRSLKAVDALSPSITHEVVEENDRLPVFFCTSSRYKQPEVCRELTIPVHWHEYMEVLFIQGGHMTAVVQADTYELHTGDLLVINSGDLHMTRTYKEPTPYTVLQISAKRLRQYFPDLELLHFDTHISSEEVHKTPGLYESIQSMLRLYQEGEDGYQLLFTARVYEFLYALYKNHSCWLVSKTDNVAGRDMSRITDIVEWTQENFRQPLTLDDAAGHLGISKEYFCRIFKKYTGQTYLDFLCATRTMNLYEELKTSDLSLTLLMEQNGLTNYKTFIRTFKELYGTTPRSVRQGA